MIERPSLRNPLPTLVLSPRKDSRETATILAALCCCRREGLLSAGHEQDIATDNGDRFRCRAEDLAQAAIGIRQSRHLRALDDIDVREDENDAGVVVGGRIEWATFTEGEYVESILVDRARATAIYSDLAKAQGVTSGTPEDK